MFINKKSDTKDAADTAPTDVKRAEAPKKEKAKPSPAADNRRLLTGVCGACVAVTVAAVGFSGLQYANATKAQREMEGSSVEVVVPADAVPRGAALTADMLTTKRVPKQYVPEDAATKASQVTGRTTLAPLTAGVPVSQADVSGSEAPGSIAGACRKGFVAKMFAMDVAPGMSPLLAPGDIVSVTGVDPNGDNAEPVVYDDVRVLACDGMLAGPASEGYATLTLELTPEQAKTLLTMAVSVSAESEEDARAVREEAWGAEKGGIDLDAQDADAEATDAE